MKEPKTIFEQILFGQEIINNNIVTLSENLNDLNNKLSSLINALSVIQISEPNTSGADKSKE